MKHEEERGVLSGLDLDACRNLDIGNEWQTGIRSCGEERCSIGIDLSDAAAWSCGLCETGEMGPVGVGGWVCGILTRDGVEWRPHGQ